MINSLIDPEDAEMKLFCSILSVALEGPDENEVKIEDDNKIDELKPQGKDSGKEDRLIKKKLSVVKAVIKIKVIDFNNYAEVVKK